MITEQYIKDYRDKLSVYIENLRDNKVYDSDELSRYTVKIIGNKKDLEEKITQLKTYGWNMDKTLISLEDVLELLETEE